MVQTQLDIPENLNKKIKVYKAKKGYGSIQEAVIDILDSKFRQEKER